MDIYLHLPFCRSKCAYCAFYSETGHSEAEIDRYLERIAGDLAAVKEPVETVYCGGGTPTLLSARQLQNLGDAIRALDLCPDAEISCEGNPETLDEEKVGVLHSFVTRFSMGIQSFHPHLRKRIGRDCSDRAIFRALALLKEAPFPHANADLIYTIPGESEAEFESDLRTLCSSGIFDHFSAYSLTPEEGTKLAAEFPVIDEDLSVRFWHMAYSVGREYGFGRYEVSNYAKEGGKCRHNCRVWGGHPYCGIGAGAAGFDGRIRRQNVADMGAFLAGAAPEQDVLSFRGRALELFSIGLRRTDGWRKAEYEETVSSLLSWDAALEKCRNASTLCSVPCRMTEDAVSLIEDAMLFWDTLAQELLEE